MKKWHLHKWVNIIYLQQFDFIAFSIHSYVFRYVFAPSQVWKLAQSNELKLMPNMQGFNAIVRHFVLIDNMLQLYEVSLNIDLAFSKYSL